MVVIAILSILSTLAFVSFKSYVSNTKDASVATDITNIHKSLWVSQLQSGKMPIPEQEKKVTSSWNNIITRQGVVWSTTKSIAQISENTHSPYYDELYGYDTNGTSRLYKIYWYVSSWNGVQLSDIRKGKDNQFKLERWDTLLNVFDESGEVAQVDITNLPSSGKYTPVLWGSVLDIDSNTVKNIPKEIEKNQKYVATNNSGPSNLPSPLDFYTHIGNLQKGDGTYMYLNSISPYGSNAETGYDLNLKKVNDSYVFFSSKPNEYEQKSLALSDLTDDWTLMSTKTEWNKGIELYDVITSPSGTENLIFSSETNRENLWATDGSEENTIQLTSDIDTIRGFIKVWNLGIFWADHPTLDSQIYVTDGTIAGTKLTKELLNPSDPAWFDQYPIKHSNKAYYIATTYQSWYNKYNIATTDGTTSNTKFIFPTPILANDYSPKKIICWDKIFALIWSRLHTYDTKTDTVVWQNIGFGFSNLFCSNNTAYVTTLTELKSTDWTDAGTQLVKSFTDTGFWQVHFMKEKNGNIYVRFNNPLDISDNIWKIDTNNNTKSLIHKFTWYNYIFAEWFAWNNLIINAKNNSTSNRELWIEKLNTLEKLIYNGKDINVSYLNQVEFNNEFYLGLNIEWSSSIWYFKVTEWWILEPIINDLGLNINSDSLETWVTLWKINDYLIIQYSQAPQSNNADKFTNTQYPLANWSSSEVFNIYTKSIYIHKDWTTWDIDTENFFRE